MRKANIVYYDNYDVFSFIKVCLATGCSPPPGYETLPVSAGSFFYKFYNQGATYSEAEAFCTADGAGVFSTGNIDQWDDIWTFIEGELLSPFPK